MQTTRVAIAEATIDSVDPALTEESIQKLRFLFPDTLILAALDLIDRDSVIKYITPWGRPHYNVLGSTATYTIFPTLSPASPLRAYCTCPAFSYAVLMSESHISCKHVLAVRLAQKMSRCVERPITEDELATIVARECS